MFLKHADLSANTGASNRERIEQHFSIEGMCAFFLSLLEQNVAAGTSRHA
jgi:hypothetical protein